MIHYCPKQSIRAGTYYGQTQYAEKIYGIKIEEPKAAATAEEEEDDIEAAIQKEVDAMNNTKKAPAENENQIFTLMKMNVDCLLFVKTKAPIKPVEFVRRICLDAKEISRHDQIKCRYVNRFTPVTVMGKTTETGIVEVAKQTLSPFFDLSGKRATEAGEPSVNNSEVEKAEGEGHAPASALVVPTGGDAQPKDYKPLTVSLSSSPNLSCSALYLTKCSMPSDQPSGTITSSSGTSLLMR